MKPISIATPQDCCGCTACAAICPQRSIRMTPDQEGFLYPGVAKASCTGCGLCRKVCPCLNPTPHTSHRDTPPSHVALQSPAVYAAWHRDADIRRHSSSGGVFTALAERILGQGGLVVGAAFDGERAAVGHIMIQHAAELSTLRGSKYVQSTIPPELFHHVRHYLNAGRPLLFSGTPCQVGALRRFLGCSYVNLFTCDFICHGVPSPKWLTACLSQEPRKVTAVHFRHKARGWKRFKLRLTFDDGSSRADGMYDNPFLCSFLRNYSLRPSCYACHFTTPSRVSDITLADFWGVATKYPQYDRHDRGTSLVLVNTAHGKAWFEACGTDIFSGAADLGTAIAGNPMLMRPAPRPPERDTFYRDVDRLPFAALRETYRLFATPTPSLWRRALGYLNRRVTSWRRRQCGGLTSQRA